MSRTLSPIEEKYILKKEDEKEVFTTTHFSKNPTETFTLKDFCTQINTNNNVKVIDTPNCKPEWLTSETISESKSGETEIFNINIHTIGIKFVVSRLLLENPIINFSKIIEEKITQQISDKQEEAILKGKGENDPKGIYSIKEESNVIKIKKTDNNLLEKLIEMHTKLPQYLLNGACWIIQNKYFSNILNLQNKNVCNYDSFSKTPSYKLLGIPIVISNYMEDKNPVILGNLKYGYYLTEGELFINRDEFSKVPSYLISAHKFTGGCPVGKTNYLFLEIE